MSENWAIQTSIKVEGQHLVNLRSEDGATQLDLLKWATENREAILAACAALGTSPSAAQKPAGQNPNPRAPGEAFAVPGPSPRELGPILLEGVEVKKGPKDGPAWKSPMYVVKWDGASASTFDALIGKAAMGFWSQGHSCFVTTEPSPKNPKYSNLISIRMAA